MVHCPAAAPTPGPRVEGMAQSTRMGHRWTWTFTLHRCWCMYCKTGDGCPLSRCAALVLRKYALVTFSRKVPFYASFLNLFETGAVWIGQFLSKIRMWEGLFNDFSTCTKHKMATFSKNAVQLQKNKHICTYTHNASLFFSPRASEHLRITFTLCCISRYKDATGL